MTSLFATVRPRTSARTSGLRLGALLGAVALAFAAPSPVAAQVPPPGTSPDEIRRQVEAMGLGDQLRQQILGSGLSADQIRQQLASRGYDPSILDPYLDRQLPAPPEPGQDVLSALQALDIQFRPDTTAAGTGQTRRDSLMRETLVLPDSSSFEREHDLRVYGLRTFARGTTEFDPMAMGAVPPGYVLGPGDEIVLILTGDVEQAYRLPVSREGFVVIPQVGQIWVNGLTMAELRDRLYGALGQAYSGIERGPQATTQFEVTLGRLRSNQLFVTGEVVRPGSYMTSPVASVLNALYLAGGPEPNGSFRQVLIRRDGRTAAEIDLYAYLTQGDNIADVVMQPGDVVFVPPAGPQVAVRGEVGRPAIYEVRPGEDVLDLIQYAGGLTAPAALGRARITRILPPAERLESGLDRTVVEVDLAAVLQGQAPAPELRDGDELRIFRVRPELRQVVSVSGAVWKTCALGPEEEEPQEEPRARGGDTTFVDPDLAAEQDDAEVEDELPEPQCVFRLAPGMRLWDAIDAAEGLRPDAYRARAQILRLDPTDSTLAVVPVSLEVSDDGVPADNPLLEEFDHVRIFARTDYRDPARVRISGEVRDSLVTVGYREGMTLGDLILEAGGLTPEADLVLEVSRRPGAEAREQGRITETLKVAADPDYIVSEDGIRYFREENPGLEAELETDLDADDFVLRPHDQVFVRRLPNIAERRLIHLDGEVRYPGDYALQSKGEYLSELIGRAGGLTETAFPGGFRFYREGQLVNVDLEGALEDPGSRSDMILLAGDSMVVPEYNPVVIVRGAVNAPAAVKYREGASLDYYIASAGGFARYADEDRVYIRYANGQGAVPRKVLFFTSEPKPGPGSVVTVPLIPEDSRASTLEIAGDVAQILASIGTALLVLTRF